MIKRISLQIVSVLSVIAVITGCERDTLVPSDSYINLETVELQLGTLTTRANAVEPTETSPAERKDWVLEVTTGNSTKSYVCLDGKQWTAEVDPLNFPYGINKCDMEFLLRPQSGGSGLQDGTVEGMLSLDTLKGVVKDQMPRKEISGVTLTHVNGLLDFTFDASSFDEVSQISGVKLEGTDIIPYRFEKTNRFQAVALQGNKSFIVRFDYKGKSYTCPVDIPEGVVSNTRYKFNIYRVINLDEIVCGALILEPWAEGNLGGSGNIAVNESLVFDLKGYTEEIKVTFSDKTSVELKPIQTIAGAGKYVCFGKNNLTVQSVSLTKYPDKTYIIGRALPSKVKEVVTLSFNSTGDLISRKDGEKILIGTVSEALLIENNLHGNYLQDKNLDFSSIEGNWTPIGQTSVKPFTGTYDGGKMKIQNLKLEYNINSNSTEPYSLGLFGYAKGAKIKNVVINGNIHLHREIPSTTPLQTFHHIGSIVGSIIAGTASERVEISGCKSAVNITITFPESQNAYYYPPLTAIGGIVGQGSDGLITLCVNSGNLTANFPNTTNGTFTLTGLGGICGYTGERILYPYPNNSVPTLRGAVISKCTNSGEINAGGSYGSGICGLMGGAASDSEVSECINTGDVYGRWAGGITAYLTNDLGNSAHGNNISKSIQYCYNSGYIEGTHVAGGLIGTVEIHFDAWRTRLKCRYSYNISKVKVLNLWWQDKVYCQGSLIGLFAPSEKLNISAIKYRVVEECYYLYQSVSDYIVVPAEYYYNGDGVSYAITTCFFRSTSWPSGIGWNVNEGHWKSLGGYNGSVDKSEYPKLSFE